MRKNIIFSIVLIISFILQIIIFPIVFNTNICPNLLLILVIVGTFFYNKWALTIIAVLSGFFIDIISGNLIGEMSLAFLIIVFAITLIRERKRMKNFKWSFFLFLIISVLIIIYANTIFSIAITPVNIVNVLVINVLNTVLGIPFVFIMFILLRKKNQDESN